MEENKPEWINEISGGQNIVASEEVKSEPKKEIPVQEVKSGVSKKSRLAMTLLSFFVGSLGVHDFYAGRIGRGLARIFTGLAGFIAYIAGLLMLIAYAESDADLSLIGVVILVAGVIALCAVGIWQLVSFILCACGKYKDSDGLYISEWDGSK